MKRLLILLVLLALVLLVAPAMAGFSVTFQDPGDFSEQIGVYNYGGVGHVLWGYNTTGGNSYVYVDKGSPNAYHATYIIPSDPGEQSTYAAATLLSSHPKLGGCGIILLDGSKNILYMSTYLGGTTGRYEVAITGGKAYIYRNGINIATSGALSQNPTYIGFGTYYAAGSGGGYTNWDDFIYGSTESKYIFSIPETGAYVLKKDMINPASSGLAWSNGTTISSYNMTTTWGVGDTNTSRTIILKEWSSASNAWTYTTTAGTMAGSIAWPLQEAIFNNPDAPYGYYITTIPGSGQVSSVIPYWAYGASIAFDQDTYSQGDTATITWSVDAGGYWDPATYNYRIDVVEFLTGDVIDTYTVTGQTGSTGTTFTDSDDPGVYYAVIIATPKAGGSDIQLNGDTCELTAYLVIHGYVNDAETTARIPVSKIKFYNNGLADYINTVDGNYTTTASFLSGSQMIINVTSTGYRPYAKNFTPVSGAGIYLNFSLVPSIPSFTGLGIGGVARDTTYGRPLSGVTVGLWNISNSQEYFKETNAAGYYLCDVGSACDIRYHRLYLVNGTKSGHLNSQTYSVIAEGSL